MIKKYYRIRNEIKTEKKRSIKVYKRSKGQKSVGPYRVKRKLQLGAR